MYDTLNRNQMHSCYCTVEGSVDIVLCIVPLEYFVMPNDLFYEIRRLKRILVILFRMTCETLVLKV